MEQLNTEQHVQNRSDRYPGKHRGDLLLQPHKASASDDSAGAEDGRSQEVFQIQIW